MKKKRIIAVIAISAMTLGAAGCATSGTDCTTETTGYVSASYVALCTPAAGPGKFFVVQGVKSLNSSGFFYLFAGYSSAPTTTASFAAGQYAMVSGRTPTTGPLMSVSYFRNATTAAPAADGTISGSGINTPDIYATTAEQEICAEFVPNSGAAPRVLFWITGQNGAICSSRTNLTQSTALVNYAAFTDTTNTLTLGQAYYRMNNINLLTASKIIVSSLGTDEYRAATGTK